MPTEPTKEALEAANECATEDGPGGLHLAMPGHQIRRVALALDRFRAAERKRCAAACNPLFYGMVGEEIRSRIVRGWTP